ncbi:MAG: class I tRNA ligase family protein, partial [Selenomonadaceae bacterium]|nr:class I tRNA ligase family protein [Selenomonadaceae bacterium]
WNTYAFFVLYANIDDFDATKYTLDYDKLSVMDKWLLSRLNTMVATVDDALTNYKVPESARALQDFVDELSNWYVRLSRARFWAKGMEQDKINAYMTLYTALVTLSKAAAPLVPFITENIYRNLVCSIDSAAPESVHLCDYPQADEKFIDAELEANMDAVLKIVVLGRAARNAANIKNRQPVANMFVKSTQPLPEFFVEIVEDELNVKRVEFRDDMSEFIRYNLKPNFRVLGKKVGKRMGEVKAALEHVDGLAAKTELDKTGEFKLGDITLTAEDVEVTITQTDGFNCQSDADFSVALSTVLTPKLVEEGFVREIISKIQVMRRESNFEVTDRIKIFASESDKLAEVITGNAEEIMSVTLADEIVFENHDGAKTWDINGEEIALAVERV